MLTLALSGNRGACLIAAAVYALWCPGIGNATMLAKENLSTPLLLGIALCAIRIARGERPAGTALVAGLLWGAAQPAFRLCDKPRNFRRSEEHTSELQSLMSISYAVLCLKQQTVLTPLLI